MTVDRKIKLVSQPIDNVTLDFLTKTLETDKYQVIPLAGDASVRRYYRIVSGETSWVLMRWEPFKEGDYPFLSVQRHFKKHDIFVPKVKKVAPSLGLILLEDLGDLTLERKFWESQHQEHIMPFYKQAIEELLKIHFNATYDSNSPCTAFSTSFNTKKLLWEMNYGREHLFEKVGSISFSNQDLKQLQEVFIKICQPLDTEDKFICHRDYHSRNLMIKLGKMRVIDFQDARMAPIQYDLVSLVHDSYVNLSPESRREILDYYLDCAENDFGHKVDCSRFEEIFTLQVIQRCFKACGSFASFFNNRQDTRYLKYIRPTLKTIIQHLAPFPEFKLFSTVITDQGFLARDYEAL